MFEAVKSFGLVLEWVEPDATRKVILEGDIVPVLLEGHWIWTP